MSELILFDNEAVQALRSPVHPKHRRVLSHVEVMARRRRRGPNVDLVVPTTARVEAGWDRTDPKWAFANHLRIADAQLDQAGADEAAGVRRRFGVSVPDAHLGALIRTSTAIRITVLSSDPDDIRTVAGSRPVNVVRI